MKNASICRRYEALKHDRYNVEETWKQLERFVRPLSGMFYGERTTGGYEYEVDWRRRDVYDSTAIMGAQSLSASLQGNLVSPSVRWFDLRFSDEKTNEKDEAKEWIEEAAEITYYELQQSNFNLETAIAFDDIVTYGNGFVIEEVDEAEQELLFTCAPLEECYFEEDFRSRIRHFYRRLMLTAEQIMDKFGEDGLPELIKTHLADDKDPAKRFDVIYCIFTRRKNEIGRIDTAKPVSPKVMPFGYKYILKQTKEQLGDEGGYMEMPAFAIRWRKTSSSIWGHGPGHIMLSNIMTVNEAVEATLESAGKMIEPPMMTSQMGLIGDLDMRRGGLNVVKDMGDLAPLPVGGDLGAGIAILDLLQPQIRRIFMEDQLELKESPAMTATEVNARYDLMQRLLGPTLGRLTSDFLDPLIERTVKILIRLGKISQPPDALRGAEFKVEYVGPLPRAQKSDQAASILGYVGQIMSLAEIRPELLDIPDFDYLFTKVADLTGVPAKGVNSPDEIAKTRKTRDAKIAEQEKMMMQNQQADTLQKAGAGLSALPPEGIQALQGSIPQRDIR